MNQNFLKTPLEVKEEVGVLGFTMFDLLDYGVYAVGFFYPVVPKGQARIKRYKVPYGEVARFFL